jgi:hypothetical protein
MAILSEWMNRLREFGSIAGVADDARVAWRFRWIEDLAGDLCCRFRTFRRRPGFAITAVVSPAVSIGTNAAIFNALMPSAGSPCRFPNPRSW